MDIYGYEMDPYVRKGKGRARRAQVVAARGRKGPPVADGGGAPRVTVCTTSTAGGVVFTAPLAGVVGEGVRRRSTAPHSSVCQGLFDELEFSDWQYNKTVTQRNAQNHTEFSLFS